MSILVLVDADCKFCQSFGVFLTRLRPIGLKVVNLAKEGLAEQFGLNPKSLRVELHAVRSKGSPKVWRGFDALMVILTHTPLLWPLLPFGWILKISGLGQPLYRFLAQRRYCFFE